MQTRMTLDGRKTYKKLNTGIRMSLWDCTLLSIFKNKISKNKTIRRAYKSLCRVDRKFPSQNQANAAMIFVCLFVVLQSSKALTKSPKRQKIRSKERKKVILIIFGPNL